MAGDCKGLSPMWRWRVWWQCGGASGSGGRMVARASARCGVGVGPLRWRDDAGARGDMKYDGS